MTATQNLRIVHCFRSPVGGIFRHVRDLVQNHAKQGHKVGILCDSTTGGAYEDTLFETIMPHLALGLKRLPIKRTLGIADVRTLQNIRKEIQDLQPDIVHGHGAKGGAIARLVGSQLRVSQSRVARFYSPHGGSLHFDPKTLQGQTFFRIERFLERYTDHLVFVSNYEKQIYIKKIGQPRPSSIVIYNGIGEAEFEPVATSRDGVDFLYIGMMRDLKGPDIFIEAMRRAEQLSATPLYAAMVGDGPDKVRYQARIDALGMAARIKTYDAMPAREAFSMARSVVIPSRAESMPYIVLETIAAQKPVIVSRVGGIPEILGQDYCGFAKPGDIETLAQLMTRDRLDPSWLQAAMPDIATFRNRFSSHAMAARMSALYQQCLTA